MLGRWQPHTHALRRAHAPSSCITRWSNISTFSAYWSNTCHSFVAGSVSPFTSMSTSLSSSTVQVWNTLTGQHEPLPTIVKWYACGPTVYDRAHLGHARAYVSQDILRRILEKKFRHNVFLVMGVTDVDDKIIQRAKEQQIPFEVLAREQESGFFDDMERLHVQLPNAITRVSEHMAEIIQYVATIQQNGYAYEATDGSGVYFRTQQLGDAYGKLDPMKNSNVSLQDVQPADLDDSENDSDSQRSEGAKQNRRDFALWKTAKNPDEPSWDSPWGKGRPGWHIECSAMTHHVLGDKLDLHSGGIDLRFPHHNNEIAQCEAHNCASMHGTPDREWCKHFVHFGHLYIRGLKMSKSLKNFISIKEFLNDHSADHFRLFCLQFKYRSNIHYSEDRIRDAIVVSDRIKRFFRNIQAYASESRRASTDQASTKAKRCEDIDLQLLSLLSATKTNVDEALMDDFNTPLALSLVLDLISRTNQYLLDRPDAPGEVLWSVAKYILEVLDLFGLEDLHTTFSQIRQLFMVNPRSSSLTNVQSLATTELGPQGEEILRSLIHFRASIREEALMDPSIPANTRILALCDSLRNDELPLLGVQVEDLAPGRSVFKLSSKEERVAAHAAAIEAGVKDEHARQIAHELQLKQQTFEELMQIKPIDFFRNAPEFAGKFSAYDDMGVPTHDFAHELLTKSQRKKLTKKLEKHTKSYDKYWKEKR